jgi:hypothetical protein
VIASRLYPPAARRLPGRVAATPRRAAALAPVVAFALVWSLATPPALAAERYLNARFGYGIDLPPGFEGIVESQNGDGGVSRGEGGGVDLAVWGSHLLDASFADEVAMRMQADEQDGWRLVYRAVTAAGASWSGTRGGDILYMRAIPLCDGVAAFFRLDYPRARAKAHDATIRALVAGFRGDGACDPDAR